MLEFFIAARFANLAVSLPQYQFASHKIQFVCALAVTAQDNDAWLFLS